MILKFSILQYLYKNIVLYVHYAKSSEVIVRNVEFDKRFSKLCQRALLNRI